MFLCESIQIWGLRRLSFTLLDREIGVPTAEYGRSLVVQCLDPHLEEQMCRAFRPLHRLPLAEALADHLIDGRFHKAGADALALPVALAIIGNESLVVLDVGVEFLNGFQELAGDTVPEAYGQNTRNCFYGIVYASASEACTSGPLPAEPCTSHLLSHVIIGVLHRQVFCVSDVVQLCVGGDEDKLADTTSRQLSMDD